MSGRGRPRQTTDPGTKRTIKKTKEENTEAERGRGIKQEQVKTDVTTGQKKPNKPQLFGELPEEAADYLRDELNEQKQQKRGGRRGKSSAAICTSSQAATLVQPDTPDDHRTSSSNTRKTKSNTVPKARVTSAKEKPCGGKLNGENDETNQQSKCLKEGGVQKIRTENKKGKTKAHVNDVQVKTKMTETSQKTSKEPTEDTREVKTPEETERRLASVLNKTLKTLKIKRSDKSNTAEVINRIIQSIVAHLKDKTTYFKNVEELPTGSYYENLKISSPDEFDVMISLLVERAQLKPFGVDGAFYSVELKRSKESMQRFQEDETLCASKILSEFRDEVKKCVEQFKEWKVDRKKPGCPAVTLSTTVQAITVSLDVVLSLKVKSSWPIATTNGLKIQNWLGTKVRRDYRLKPFYLVPKYKGRAAVEIDGILAKDAWRISFSHIEKAILKNHGEKKTCCERGRASCCRKDCLKLLKHLLTLLKEEKSVFNKFYTYLAKTTLLQACCLRPHDSQWSASDLSHCFLMLTSDFLAHLRNGKLDNFFIPEQNLLSDFEEAECNSLADRLEEECRNDFPIFKKYISQQGV